MDVNEFREFGKAAIDFIADYHENIRDRDVIASVTPGYLRPLLPDEVPEEAERWQDVMEDMKKFVLPGVTHWQSPHFHAYYQQQSSYQTIVGEMLVAAFGTIGLNWIACPASTELEVIVMDWLAKLLDLPKHFLHSDDGPGGGVLLGSASEAIALGIIAAREETVKRTHNEKPEMSISDIRGKLVAYSSDQCNSAIEKSSSIAALPLRVLKTMSDCRLTGDILEKAILEDLENGFIPTVCVATIGTTPTCAFDDLEGVGLICKKYNVWLHVDAAYAGAALCCPEYRYINKGIEYVESFNFNLHKWMMVNFDCAAFWLKKSNNLTDTLTADRVYLKHEFQGKTKVPDFYSWQVALGRKFRSLKVWIVLRTLGVKKLQDNIRDQVALADRFAAFIKKDQRFELLIKSMGLVCFRLRGDCHLTKKLLENVTKTKKVFMLPSHLGEHYVIRFVVNGVKPEERDIDFAWKIIITETEKLLTAYHTTAMKISDQSVTKLNEIMSELNL